LRGQWVEGWRVFLDGKVQTQTIPNDHEEEPFYNCGGWWEKLYGIQRQSAYGTLTA
jgi:hypothetical protein